MKQQLFGYFLCIIPMLSCTNGSDQTTTLEHKIESALIKTLESDSIQYTKLSVKIVTENDHNRLNILWTAKFYPHEEFIMAYNERLIAELDEGLTKDLDSLILEVVIPNSDFKFKRYRADQTDLKNLRLLQSEVDPAYYRFLHFVALHKLEIELEFFDNFLQGFYSESKMKELSWMENGFLTYVKNLFTPIKNTEDHLNRITLLRDFMGTGALWHERDGAVIIVNHLLKEFGEPPLNELDSTRSDYKKSDIVK